MVFAVLTPLPASNSSSSDMSHPAPSNTRLRLHPSPGGTSAARVRDSIISSSAKGWSPLQINKRDGAVSPLRQSPNPSHLELPSTADGPRRTSNSFKHVTRNSLVANSPFKNLETTQGKQAAGMEVAGKGKEVIHERRGAGESRKMGEELPSAEGSAATPKAAIGLGISAVKPRSTSRTSSSSRSAVTGTRKVSGEKIRVSIPSSSAGENRRSSAERRSSADRNVGSKENESPNVHASQRMPRQSSGVKGLKESSHVSRSPFVVGRRVPSGEAALGSPIPSPRSQPSTRQAPSSPSPRRTSGQRKVSPAHQRSNAGSSPTPSPPRRFNNSSSLNHASPLGKHYSSADFASSPGPKSALTPSRRLLGPRHALGLHDSPSKQAKTVTFQSVPDVKEFEQMSIEGSADGSFDIELDSGSEYDRDWVDEGIEGTQGDDSLEEIMPNARGVMEGMDKLRIDNSSPMPADHDESTTADFVNTLIEEGLFSPQQTPALGDQQTPAFEDQPAFDPPSGDEEGVPYLSTPSLGDDVLMSPMFTTSGLPEINYPEKDSAGAPYGRTHHAERSALAHSLPPLVLNSPISALPLPTSSNDQMLLNADATQPALPATRALPTPGTSHLSHQVEPLHDPFITIQTATSVISPQAITRAEGGIPLGRTGHADRVNAARALATQSLGLGMPRMPTRMPSDEMDAGSESGSEVDSGSDDDERFFNPSGTPAKQAMKSSTTTRLSPAVEKVELAMDGETPRRGLPKLPPMVQEVKVPSPIQSPVVAQEEKTEKRSSRLDFSGFALPLINMTSPFFRTTPTLDSQVRIPSNDASTSGQSTEDDDRPITPSPSEPTTRPVLSTSNDDVGNTSAHRIPSFEFEEIKLTSEEMLVRRATVQKNPHSPTKPTSMSTSTSSGFTNPYSPEGSKINNESGSIRVRQRISREMIRETIDRKYADGSISRRPHSTLGFGASSMDSQGFMSASTSGTGSGFGTATELKRASTPGGGYSTSVAPPPLSASSSNASARNKELPPPPPVSSTPMLKSSTDRPRSNAPQPPINRPHSAAGVLGAGEVIRQSSQMGKEPSSGLDRIIAGNAHIHHAAPTSIQGLPQRASVHYGPTADIGRPVSILQNPHQYIPPMTSHQPTPRQPSRSETAPVRARPISAADMTTSSSSSQDFGLGPSGSRGRDASGLSAIHEGGSRNSRKSRRSMSMSDANEEIRPPSAKRQPRLTLGLGHDQESMSEAFADEMESISGDRNYKVREKHVLGASFGNTVSHSKAGDIDGGKAWRQLRRPSDINEHAAEIRAMRDMEASHGKASGTIFVKVLGIESLLIPVPAEPTYFCMTLDNGIDYIRTPYVGLQEGAKVNQEFALVEHPNFEFSLSLDVRRDPHIIRSLQDQNNLTVTRQPSITHAKTTSTGSGIRNLFSSPRKNKNPPSAPPSRPITPLAAPAPTQPTVDTIARYLATPNSSTVAKTHVAFKPIAKQCETKILEIRYPMFAMFKGEADRPREGGKAAVASNTPRRQVAKVTLQIFRLPPLPGIKPEDLPQCIEECLRGMRHHAWHECEYHEGNLTQEGGDCTIPRRRIFKLIGGNMVAYNEITKKEMTTIDLRQAIAVVDLNPDQSQRDLKLAAGRKTPGGGGGDDEDGGMGMFGARPRSFKVEFKRGDGIVFSADKDSDKTTWMETLNGLIGKIPSNPLWAELLASLTKDKHDRATAARSVGRSTTYTTATSTSGPTNPHRMSVISGTSQGKREISQAMGKTRSAPVQVQTQSGLEGGRTMSGRKAEGIV